MKGAHLGEFEELTLLAVLALPDEAYGIAVQELLEQETGREVTLGAVYAALERMERKGLLQSATGEPTADRGGRRRRLFTVTGNGLEAVSEARRAREAIRKSLPKALRSRT